MPDITPKLGLPYILPAQAQKHVTHNEALVALDAVTQLVLEDIQLTAPPGSFALGQIWGVGTAATGAWAGQDGRLAQRADNGWQFLTPAEGWRAWVKARGEFMLFRSGAWTGLPLENLSGVGINTTSNATNRLSVSSAASLFTHAGAGHQIKVNKAGISDTASLLFQSNWSGRAEIGLAGTSDLSVKVSNDGSTWRNGMVIAAATGRTELPGGATLSTGTAAAPALTLGADPDSGLFRTGDDELGVSLGGIQRILANLTGFQIDLPVTGTSVMQNALDGTAGRLMRINSTYGAFGLGATYGPQLADLDLQTTATGLYFFNLGNGTTGTSPGFTSGGMLVMSTAGSGSVALAQLAFQRTSGAARIAWRCSNSGAWGSWRSLLNNTDILGTVSQASGVPTGSILQRGSGATGEFVRYADGTQICTHTLNGSTTAAVTWTYPSAFAVAPVVNGTAQATVLSCVCLDAAPTATAATFSARDKLDARRADSCRLVAVGRWF